MVFIKSDGVVNANVRRFVAQYFGRDQMRKRRACFVGPCVPVVEFFEPALDDRVELFLIQAQLNGFFDFVDEGLQRLICWGCRWGGGGRRVLWHGAGIS